MKLFKKKPKPSIDRITPDYKTGLSSAEIEARVKMNLNNRTKSSTSKPIRKIIVDNTCTFFTLVLFLIALVFLICNTGVIPGIEVGSISITKFAFLLPLICNIIIGIFQEIRSKITLDKLRIVNENKYSAIRDSKEVKISSSNIVIDDIIILAAGEQVPADFRIVDGTVEVNESLLTGESDNVKKTVGDTLMSGSAIVSGKCYGIATAVGSETYAMKLQAKVKHIEKNKSELMKNIYGIIKILSILLVIVVAITIPVLIYKMNTWNNITITEIVTTTGAVAVGMIPTGLILLTSVTLAVSVIKLAQNKTLVQELYSLENLSRIDTICLDKTGTLTDGTMSVEEIITVKEIEHFDEIMSTFLNAMPTNNQTSIALLKKFTSTTKYKVKDVTPFSSSRKMSKVTLENGNMYILGAPEYLVKEPEYINIANNKSANGKRVLAFLENDSLVCLIVLRDNIRESAPSTIRYFNENHVDVKIISGDNPITVSKIAADCGVNNADKIISLENIPLEEIPNLVDSFTIFGRVTPEQKEALVSALQAKGHKVAMTGDGVNDILALKKANSSISFENATDAAKRTSDVILLDNDFGHLKEVVKQGRRVVNNIQRTAILFLMKSIFIMTIALTTIPTKEAITILSIENLYLLEFCIIALGGFLLSMENTNMPITGSFKKNVYSKAFASGLLLLAGAWLAIGLYQADVIVGENAFDRAQAMFTILSTIAGFAVLYQQCKPFTKYKIFSFALCLGLAVLLVIALPNIFLNPPDVLTLEGIIDGLFNFDNSIFASFTRIEYVAMIGFSVLSIPIYIGIIKLIDFLLSRNMMKKITEKIGI